MRRATFILLLAIMTSCSASWHIRKAMRKDPSLFVADTVTRVDTVLVTVARVDTVFKYKMDTVEYWQDSVYVKYHYDYRDSLVYIEVDCPDNEVITKTNTVTKTVKIRPTFWERIEALLVGLIVLILVIVVFMRIWGLFKRR